MGIHLGCIHLGIHCLLRQMIKKSRIEAAYTSCKVERKAGKQRDDRCRRAAGTMLYLALQANGPALGAMRR
jgi:hypothetical protein